MRKIVELKIEETKTVVGGIKVAATASAPAKVAASVTAQQITVGSTLAA
jgi:hypothetical protein